MKRALSIFLVLSMMALLFSAIGCGKEEQKTKLQAQKSGTAKTQTQIPESNDTQNMGEKLSRTRYIDPKGYFKIAPPAGWRIEEYPQDPRGKVAFHCPEANVELRVLINAVDFSTIEELITSSKKIEKRIGEKTNIKKIMFTDRHAIERSFKFKGQKLYYIDFLVGKIDHNIAYSAPRNKYNKYLPIVMKSMETYEPIFDETSDHEVAKHAVAKKKRLTQLMIEHGNYDLALEFIKEGLELSPKDSDLLTLKQQIEDKVKKR